MIHPSNEIDDYDRVLSPSDRFLDEGQDSGGPMSSASDLGGPINPSSSSTTSPEPLLRQASNTGQDGFSDFQLFWVVNGIVVLSVVCVVIYCCHKRGDNFVSSWAEARSTGTLSDFFYASGVARRREEEEERRKENPERRKERLLECFETNGVRLVVKQGDFVGSPKRPSTTKDTARGAETATSSSDRGEDDPEPNDDAKKHSDGGRDDDLEVGIFHNEAADHHDAHSHHDADSRDTSTAPPAVALPSADGSSSRSRSVPNCCAICLCPYDVDDVLIWSSNTDCRHAFHEECIVEWLVKMQSGNPCPCCRREFVVLPEEEAAIKVDPLMDNFQPAAFNLATISWL